MPGYRDRNHTNVAPAKIVVPARVRNTWALSHMWMMVAFNTGMR